MFLKFTATPEFDHYHDKPMDWKNGIVQDVEEKRAKQLIADFPDHFSEAKGEKATPPPAANKMEAAPGKNK